jgi:spermidine/putrescine transport system ATP-binding protein
MWPQTVLATSSRTVSAATSSAGTETERTASSILDVINAAHFYGDVVALDNVIINAAPDEFLTILGESGRGRRRSFASSRAWRSQDRRAAPERRGHDGCPNLRPRLHDGLPALRALSPHECGRQCRYGFKVRACRPPNAERSRRAREALQLVRLADRYDRKIHRLNGGERRSMALAGARAPTQLSCRSARWTRSSISTCRSS